MDELDRSSGAFGVNGVGEPSQAGKDLLPHPQLGIERSAVEGDRAVRDRCHRDSAGGECPVVLDEPVGDDAVGRKPLEASGAYHPVAEPQTVDRTV
jgi:hypothetical protein